MKSHGFFYVLAFLPALLPALSLTGCASAGSSAGMEKWDIRSIEVREHAKAFRAAQPAVKPGMNMRFVSDFVRSQSRMYMADSAGGDTVPFHSSDSLGDSARAKVSDLAYQLQVKGNRAFVVSRYDSLRYELKLKRDGAQWSFFDVYDPGDTSLLGMTASTEGDSLILSKLDLWPGAKDTNDTYMTFRLAFARDSTGFVSRGRAKHRIFPVCTPDMMLVLGRKER